MKKTIFLFVVSISTILFSQMGGINDPMREVFPNTPNAAEMTQYGKVSIGEFTGTMQHSIPLYEINYKGINIPITLNYNSNGVNIDKYESSVGIDWGLNSGGVITRILMDGADEMVEYFPFPDPPYGPNYTEVMSRIDCGGACDIQPDIFSFNIMGYCGRFYIKNEGVNNINVYLIDQLPVKIEILSGIIKETNYNENEFDIKITLPNGVKYYFGGQNAFETIGSMSINDNLPPPHHTPPTLPIKNSFYLSKIETIDGSFVKFLYNSSTTNRITGISQSVKIKREELPQGTIYMDASQNIDNSFSPTFFKSFVREVLLSSIEWGENKVEFFYNQKLVNEILVKANGNLIKKWLLEYQEFESDELYPTECTICDNNIVTKRKFLKNIINKSLFNSNQDEIISLEYYNPEKLPSKFSFSRDYWGYHNGKHNDFLISNNLLNFNRANYSSEGSQKFSDERIRDLFSTVGGDRNTDPNYAIYGLLKKIIYPTKGWTEIEYEANSYFGEVVIPGEQELVQLGATKTDITHTPVTDSRIITLPSNQTIKLINAVAAIEPPYCELEDTGHAAGTLKITDVADDSIVFIHTFHPNEPPQFFNGQADHTYNFTLSVNWPCTSATVTFHYESTPPIIEQKNIPYGGMRVSKIINKDYDNNILTQEKYLYGDTNCLECSNAVIEMIKPGISFFEFVSNVPQRNNYQTATLGSSSLNSLYFGANTPIAYPFVSKKVIDGTNKSTGLILRRYSVVVDTFPVTFEGEGDWIVGTPYTNEFGNGDLLKEEIYKLEDISNEFVMISEKENFYKFDNSIYYYIEGHNVSLSKIFNYLDYYPDGSEYNNYLYNVNKYKVQSKLFIADYSIEKNYTDDGVLETRTDYYYDGANKLLKSKETITDSNGKTLETTFSYPPDLIGLEQTPFMQDLTDANRIAEPVITRTTRGDKQYLEKHLKYGQNQSTGNLLLPVELHTKKGFNSININNSDDRKLTYTKYDTGGNLLEYLTEDGSPVSLIWGYDSQYPIAKIEGVANTNLPSQKVTALQNLSDSGQLSAESFYDLINSVDGMVTAYTYEPLVGVKTITQPNGTTAYYEYDDFGRLISVKDTDGNVLKEVQYNFKQ